MKGTDSVVAPEGRLDNRNIVTQTDKGTFVESIATRNGILACTI